MNRIGKVLFFLWFIPLSVVAQINTDRVMLMGRNALYYEDYVLSIRRFNMVISAKPYLPEPYFFRGLAKFYLEDYIGAEADCSEAIELNPFLPDNYRLRGLCRINLDRYEDAVSDYNHLLEIEPKEESCLHNMTLCYLQLKDYDKAIECVNRMLRYWPRKSSLYTLKAQAYFMQKDTTAAMESVDRALEINPYEGQAWNMKAAVYADRGEYRDAEEALDKTIQQTPREPGHYINRALTRYHQRNLRGAMDDYDIALELDSVNYIGHFNRGLLRAQVGDDNRAIEDFNFVLRLEPDNMIALFNRALLLENTGDYQAAIKDINTVIEAYPNFWTGYQFRAGVLRKLGDTKAAERDEFKVLKAQMDMRYGTNNSVASAGQTRKVSDRTIEDYNKLVEADTEDRDTPVYESDYRGKVQNRRTELTLEPLCVLTYYVGYDTFRRKMYSDALDLFNRRSALAMPLLLTCSEEPLNDGQIQKHFSSINNYSDKISRHPDNAMLYFARSMDEFMVQDFEKALADINRSIEIDDVNLPAYCLRVQIRVKNQVVRMAEAIARSSSELSKWDVDNSRTEYQKALDDCDFILAHDPTFVGCHYNKGYIYSQMKLWAEAIVSYTKAIEQHTDFAEAYYNRGIAYIMSGNPEMAIPDLSRAGELGLYKAYNLIKRYSDKSIPKKE